MASGRQYDTALRAILAHYTALAEQVHATADRPSLARGLALTLGAQADSDIQTCVAANPQLRPLACAKGCSWCCRGTRVDAHVPEIALLADALQALPADALRGVQQRVQHAALGFRTRPGRELWLEQAPCALLDEHGRCLAYGARPLVCRAFHSHDASLCERVHRAPGNDDSGLVQTDALYSTAYSAARGAIVASGQKRGLDMRPLELNNALLVALTTPDAAARWASGEQLFGPAALPPDPAEAAARAQVAAELRRRARNARKTASRRGR
jgi:Fe-S-cluster containining protein